MSPEFPEGKKFAFTIMDDTDEATLENIRPVYDCLRELGLRTTKTVWVNDTGKETSPFRKADTISRVDYRDYVQELQAAGFEITWHCAAMHTSRRVETMEGIEKLRDMFGVAPRVHANHAFNRENIYWGMDRFDDP